MRAIAGGIKSITRTPSSILRFINCSKRFTSYRVKTDI